MLSARAFPTIVAYAVSADAIGRGACAISADLGKDTDRARALLAKMVGKVILRRDGDRLIGEVKGNLPGLLDLEGEESFGSGGAGRGFCDSPYDPGQLVSSPSQALSPPQAYPD